MKNLIVIISFVLSSMAFGQTNKFDQLFQQMQNKKGITTLVLNKSMFDMMNNGNLKNEMKELNKIMKAVESINMIVVENNADKNLKSNLKNTVKNLKFQELMAINKDANQVKIYTENANSKSFKNLLLDISSNNKTAYLVLKGNFKISDIQNSFKVITK